MDPLQRIESIERKIRDLHIEVDLLKNDLIGVSKKPLKEEELGVKDIMKDIASKGTFRSDA